MIFPSSQHVFLSVSYGFKLTVNPGPVVCPFVANMYNLKEEETKGLQ